MGGPERLQVQRFCEAAHDPATGLTYSALTGVKKQSVGDVERLFSSEVAGFMERKKYTYEANYIRTIHNWRRATDERGLTQQERSEFSKKMLNMVLDELIPWHRELDYSTLEVNRYNDYHYSVTCVHLTVIKCVTVYQFSNPVKLLICFHTCVFHL